jgi:hypothetical protein
VLSFFYDQNRFSSDRDRGDVGVWAPLACAHDWTCDSQSVVDFAKWRQNRDRVDADTRRVTEARRRDRTLIQLVHLNRYARLDKYTDHQKQ